MNNRFALVVVHDGTMHVIGHARSQRVNRARTEARELAELMRCPVSAIPAHHVEPTAVDLTAAAVPVSFESLDSVGA